MHPQAKKDETIPSSSSMQIPGNAVPGLLPVKEVKDGHGSFVTLTWAVAETLVQEVHV